jgi:hypothetical protein
MKFLQALRRIARLSPKKKAAAASFAVLFALVVVAAYLRSHWLLGLLVAVFVSALAAGVLYMDRLLKASRRATKRAVAAQSKLAAILPDPRPGALVEWGARSRIPEARLAQRLTKLRSVDGRDVLVSTATTGQWGWRDMAVALEMYRIGGKTRRSVQSVLDKTPRTVLLHLGDLCFRQNVLQDDILNAATLYKYVFQRLGAKPFREKRRGEFFLDALARTGQGEEVIRLQYLYKADEMNANDVHLYRANAANRSKTMQPTPTSGSPRSTRSMSGRDCPGFRWLKVQPRPSSACRPKRPSLSRRGRSSPSSCPSTNRTSTRTWRSSRP